MSVGLFTDKGREPTEAEIDQALGTSRRLWEGLNGYIRETYPVQEDVKFMYGKTYGWARRFRIKKQLLTSLYPADCRYMTQVNLSPGAVQAAQGMGLGANVEQAIARATPYPEGRWLFVAVESEQDVEDIKRLLALRVEMKAMPKR